MEEKILSDNINNFIYLRIPDEYYCVYKNLLKDLSNIGIRGIEECKKNISFTCNNNKKIDIVELFKTWNMFQIACSSYILGEIGKANYIINYIIKNMGYCCENIDRIENNIIYFGQAQDKPSIEFIKTSSFIEADKTNKFTFTISTKFHFIAIPEYYSIETIDNTSFRGDWLYNPDLDIDLYEKEPITINGNRYTLWFCEMLFPFNAGVEIKI